VSGKHFCLITSDMMCHDLSHCERARTPTNALFGGMMYHLIARHQINPRGDSRHGQRRPQELKQGDTVFYLVLLANSSNI
jgi:hypothetical protein